MNKLLLTSLGIMLLNLKTSCQIKPWEAYPALFHDVQMLEIFEDSKTFADCIPLFAPETIQNKYLHLKSMSDFTLEDFIQTNFSLPPSFSNYRSDTSLSVEEHIDNLWNVLMRKPDKDTFRNSSLITLPYNYIVPGGRFREIYYWDSYFSMLGLIESGEYQLARTMVANFAWMIDRYGFVPNGNRTYYLSRSQPPYFSLMVSLLARIDGDSVLSFYLPQMEREYTFWMEGKKDLKSGSNKRLVKLGRNKYLNRFWDDNPEPRPEAYREDVLLARLSKRKPEELYLNLRAAAESGWDFSSRWLTDMNDLKSIHTTDIVPPDLNSLIYNMELTISRAALISGKPKRAKEFKKHAARRKKLLMKYCWDPSSQWFRDYDFRAAKFTPVMSLAGVYPFFLKLAPEKASTGFAKNIREKFLLPGGVVCTLTETGEQWDYPNGWPPLQFITIMALRHYGQKDLSETCMSRWLTLNEWVFKRTGKMLEKYDVVRVNRLAGGGEYPTQDGFGWTNGVYIYLIRNCKK